MTETPTKIAYVGCWYKNDMYSHNCSNLVYSIRRSGVDVDVVTSNCRCFSSRERFAINEDELIDKRCRTIGVPCAPRNPTNKRNLLKYVLVKILRLDLIFDAIRGLRYYLSTRHAEAIYYDQVLEAFGILPLFIMSLIPRVRRKKLIVTVHEIDPFQISHPWVNRLYGRCQCIFVFSADMKRQLTRLGISDARMRVIRYGTLIPELAETKRSGYIYFGGHHILKGKGYCEVLDALHLLKVKGVYVRLLIYFGKGCTGVDEAQNMAQQRNVDEMIEWREFLSGDELDKAYQSSRASIIPYTGGSARHPLSSAMANATPIIATRNIDIPEYLEDLGIYVDGSGESIAAAIEKIEQSPRGTAGLGDALRSKAAVDLNFDEIAKEVVCQI